MKKLKKIASVALALVMAMALMVPAFATGENGTITIKNATVDETYTVYKIFDATYSGAGTDKNAAYTIDSGSKWFTLVQAKSDFFTLTQVGTSTTYNVQVKDGGLTAADVKDWIASITLPANDGQVKAATSTVTFNDLGSGYFLVTSTLDADGNPDTAALITLTNADPSATIIDKNQKPGGGDPNDNKKTVTKIDSADATMNDGRFSAEIGDTVTYEIRTTATNYDGEDMIKYYKVEDVIKGTGLVLAENMNLVVKVGDTTITDYDLTKAEDNKSFTVQIPWTQGTGANEAPKYASPVVISISYDTVVTADITANTAVNNEVTVSYKPGDKPETPEDKKLTEALYTYALAIKKTDKSGNNLANAKFELALGNETLYFTKSGNVYTLASSSADGATTEIVTDSNGLAVIKGVKQIAYTLTETEAPAGYNKLTETKTVTPKLATETKVTKYLDEDGNVTEVVTEQVVDIDAQAEPVVVVNFTGAELPSTGGMGTTLFYAIGGVLLAGSAILFVTKKRMGE